MPTDVSPAENVAALEIAPAPEPTSFLELQKTWTSEEKTHWNRTGEEPKPKELTATPLPEPDVQPEPLPEKAEVKPDEGPGDEDQDQEPEYYGTADQQKAQRKAFARLKRERTELKTELKLLREQHAAKPADAAPAPKAEAKASVIERPKRPKMKDFSGDGAAEAYDDAMDAHEEAMVAYYERIADSKVQTLGATTEAARDQAKFEARVEARGIGKSAYFSDDFPSSMAMNLVIQNDPEGLDYVPLLTPMEGKRIQALTEVPNFDELYANPETRAHASYLFGMAHATAKAELQKLVKVQDNSGPKPITKTTAPTPGTRVSANTAAAGDPLAEANANYERTRDHKYLAEINRLENERDRVRLGLK